LSEDVEVIRATVPLGALVAALGAAAAWLEFQVTPLGKTPFSVLLVDRANG
jgi:hypothetical protein